MQLVMGDACIIPQDIRQAEEERASERRARESDENGVNDGRGVRAGGIAAAIVRSLVLTRAHEAP